MDYDLFNFDLPSYKINKPIRLIEFFAGYGSQILSLKYLGIKNAHYKICEWATKSIQAYNDLHIQDYTDYSKDLELTYLLTYLHNKGISMNYNEPMSYEQIKRKGEQWVRKTYNNIIATNNLVNICNVKSSDLELDNNYCNILTYSYPCQDISLAGKQKGMEKGSGTRSALLWEVDRILHELPKEDLPQILLMENVPQCSSGNNLKEFIEWQNRLEKLGYKNYYQNLNAKDYGIPQNRNRTFMVSILGNYSYEFPKSFESKDRLKDFLENNVDEKYYLSEKMISYISAPNQKRTGNNNGAFINKDVASALNTGEGSRRCDASNYFSEDLPNNYNLQNTDKIMVVGKSKSGGERSLILDEDGICNCLSATDYKQPKQILIKEKTKKGYTETNDDYLGTYQFAKSDNFMKGKEGVVTVGNYSPSGHNASRIVDSKGIAPTVMENHGTVTATVVKDEMPKLVGGIGEKKSNGGTQYYQQDRVYDSETVAMCHCVNIPNGSYNYQLSDLRIRKLTEKECFRLMGLKDIDIDNVMKNQSKSSCYHLAGDSIVVNVLMAIFKNLQ